MLLFKAVVFLILFNCALGFGAFWRGRRFGGNIGDPDDDLKSINTRTGIVNSWFTQKLDHFDPTNSNTWQQRFYVNDRFWTDRNGPIFLMIGGEGEATSTWMLKGAWIKYAEQFGALCFMVEHRFYGRSQPTR
jgi:hypothetical protein